MNNSTFAVLLVALAAVCLGVVVGVAAVAPAAPAAPVAAVDGAAPDAPQSLIATHPPTYAGTPVAVDYDAPGGFLPGRPVLRFRP